MKYLLSSVAIVAALAIASPVSAQGYGPGPGAATGTGPGVTPPGGLGPSSPLSNLPGQGAPGYAPPPSGTNYPPAGVMPYAQATEEVRKGGYKNAHDWKQSGNSWSADAEHNGQNVHVVVGANGQITETPAR